MCPLHAAPARQRGISLVMAMIMLVLLSMIAISATYSTTSSLRIVGNMQMQEEALNAAQAAIDDQLNTLARFTTPEDRYIDIDINQDGARDYQVLLKAPICIAKDESTTYSVKVTGSGSAPETTYWEATAEVTDDRTGAKVTLNQGVSIRLLPYMGCP